MSASFELANRDILTLFDTAWDTTGLVAIYENVANQPKPSTQAAFAKVFVRHLAPGGQTLTGATGTTRYDRTGLITVQIFIPNGNGLSLGYSLGKVVTDAFEGVASPLHVWFRNARLNEIGPSGEWFQFNALIDFEYDEIK